MATCAKADSSKASYENEFQLIWKRIQALNCPLTRIVDLNHVMDLLTVEEKFRCNLLEWMLTEIHPPFGELIRKKAAFPIADGSDEHVKRILKMMSAVGLCKATDMHLIKGTPKTKQLVQFYNQLLDIMTYLRDKPQCPRRAQRTQMDEVQWKEINHPDQSFKYYSPDITVELRKKAANQEFGIERFSVAEQRYKLQTMKAHLDSEIQVLESMKLQFPSFTSSEKFQAIVRMKRTCDDLIEQCMPFEFLVSDLRLNFGQSEGDVSQLGPPAEEACKILLELIESFEAMKLFWESYLSVYEIAKRKEEYKSISTSLKGKYEYENLESWNHILDDAMGKI